MFCLLERRQDKTIKLKKIIKTQFHPLFATRFTGLTKTYHDSLTSLL